MEKRHLIKSGIAKIPIVILISLILISLVSAVDFRQIYNPFTRQPDYYRSSNFSGYNLTADYFFGSGEYLININTSGLIKKERDPIWQGNSSWIISNASINYSINTYEMWNTKWSAMNHSTFNKTYEDHTNLINEHIDWTNATDNFKTSGMINVTYLNNKGSIIYTRSDGDLMLTPAGNFIGIYKDIDWIGFGVGESTAKYMFFSWRNALERGEFGTSGYNYPMMFNNILYLDEDDRVGIKTNSPVTELDVNGNVTADYYYGIFTGNVTGNMNWTSLQNYPVACPGTGAITQLGDSVTCSDLWVNVAGDNMTGNLNVSGNVTADYFFGSGANLFDVNTSGFVTTESDPIWQGNSSWIISNASINYSLKTYNLWDERWTSTFNSTYQSYQDTNATTACSSGEVLLGNGSCMDSILYYDDTDTDTWWDIVVGFLYNNSGSLDIDTNVLNATIDDRLIPDTNASTICSSEQVLLGNTSCMSSDLYYDDTTIPDTNVSTICSNEEVLLGNTSCMSSDFFYGGVDTDTWWDLAVGWFMNISNVLTFNSTLLNETIDMRVIPDTNASTICSSEQVLLGNTSCMSSDLFYDDTTIQDTNVSTFCSTSEVLLGNGTCTDSDLFFDYITFTESDPIWQGNATWLFANSSINYSINTYSMWNFIWSEMTNSSYLTSYIDTNASTICSVDQVLLGNTSCMSSALFYDDTTITEIDPIWQGNSSKVISDLYNCTNDTYLTSFTEIDPIWQGNSSWIISNASLNYSLKTYEMWNTKWSEMNHSTFNKTYQDHTNLINEHIDWTGASENFETSGTGIFLNDFNVEGRGLSNLLFVNTQTDKVGIITNQPTHELTVIGTVNATAFIGDGSLLTSLEIYNKTYENHINLVNEHIDWTNATDTLNTSGNIISGEYLYHQGDTDTFIRFQDDNIAFNAGGINFLYFSEGATDNIIFNGDQQDVDFVVYSKGPGAIELISTDAENKRVGIGTATPATRLDVAGNVTCRNDVLTTGITYMGWERVEQSTSTSALGYANCPSGKKLLGGGCDQYDLTQQALRKSYPYNDTAWCCQYASSVTTLNAYAICGRVDN